MSRRSRPGPVAVRFAAAVLLLAALAAPAFAHAMLRMASPSAGATVRVAPARVTLTFSEAVEPAFSSVEVRDAAGARVDLGAVAQDGSAPNALVVRLKPLAAGVYTVVWHATSVDTHRTEGRFSFTLAP